MFHLRSTQWAGDVCERCEKANASTAGTPAPALKRRREFLIFSLIMRTIFGVRKWPPKRGLSVKTLQEGPEIGVKKWPQKRSSEAVLFLPAVEKNEPRSLFFATDPPEMSRASRCRRSSPSTAPRAGRACHLQPQRSVKTRIHFFLTAADVRRRCCQARSTVAPLTAGHS